MCSDLMFNRTVKEGDGASVNACGIKPRCLEIPKSICTRVPAEF